LTIIKYVDGEVVSDALIPSCVLERCEVVCPQVEGVEVDESFGTHGASVYAPVDGCTKHVQYHSFDYII
jgi:hypothetical protein